MIFKPKTLITLYALFSCIGSSIGLAVMPPPTIPLAKLDRYQTSIVSDQLESISVDRLHLIGPVTIGMDVPAGYRLDTNVTNASVSFTNKSSFSYNLFSFQKTAVNYSIDADTLNLYLENLALTHPPEAEFEILEPAVVDTGRAKFRILGRKAITIRYALNIEEQRIIYAENWVQFGERVYIIQIIGPTMNFEAAFNSIRLGLNSMHLVE